jgi:hypothetical protein
MVTHIEKLIRNKMHELQLTGGARIGMVNATFPFATLKVNKDQGGLNVSIVGNLTFQASHIISIEPYTMIPILGQGIKINYEVTNYKERVIFWTFNFRFADTLADFVWQKFPFFHNLGSNCDEEKT